MTYNLVFFLVFEEQWTYNLPYLNMCGGFPFWYDKYTVEIVKYAIEDVNVGYTHIHETNKFLKFYTYINEYYYWFLLESLHYEPMIKMNFVTKSRVINIIFDGYIFDTKIE